MEVKPTNFQTRLNGIMGTRKFARSLKDRLYNDHKSYKDLNNDPLTMTIEILQKSFNSRNSKEIEKICTYLQSMTEFIQMLITDHDTQYNDIVRKVALNLTYKFIPKHEIVFRYGDRGNEFFIILKGKINIYVPKLERVYMSEEDYIKYLLQLRKNNEIELLNKCIAMNISSVNIDDNFDNWLRFQVSPFSNQGDALTSTFSVRRKLSQRASYDLKKLTNYNKEIFQCIAETLDYIDNNKVTDIKNLRERRRVEIFPSNESYINSIKCTQRNPLLENGKYFNVFSYSHINTLSTGSKFGELALDSKINKRTATLIAEHECHLGVVDRSSYDKSLKSVNEKSRRNLLSFLLSYHILIEASKLNFERNFFNSFIYHKFNRGENVIRESQATEYVYFLKSGEYEITTSRNLLEVNELCDVLDKESIVGSKHHESPLEKENQAFLQEKKFNDEKFNHLVFTRKNIKLGIIKDKEVIGFKEFFDNKTKLALVNITSISSNCEGYLLPIQVFKLLCSKELSVKINYEDFVELKRKFLYERLISYKEQQLDEYKRRSESKIFQESKCFNFPLKKYKHMRKFSVIQTSNIINNFTQGRKVTECKEIQNSMLKFSVSPKKGQNEANLINNLPPVLSPTERRKMILDYRAHKGFRSIANKDQLLSEFSTETKPSPYWGKHVTNQSQTSFKVEPSLSEEPVVKKFSCIAENYQGTTTHTNQENKFYDTSYSVLDKYNSFCHTLYRSMNMPKNISLNYIITSNNK